MNDQMEIRPKSPSVVIYTMAGEGRLPKAAWFDGTVKATATLYGDRQGFQRVDVLPTQVDLVKAAVPEGEVTPAKKVALPAVKKDVLERLMANLAGKPIDAADGSGKLPAGVMPTFVGSSDDIPVSTVPIDPLWSALTVNMVVLAPEYTDQGVVEGWWEAIITAITGDVLTLRFRDYPRQPLIHRKRDEIGLMHPVPVRA